jgi:putative NIF3 family GTP cyclohydrolase 1 type 2
MSSKKLFEYHDQITRRKFLAASALLSASSLAFNTHAEASVVTSKLTIQQVIDIITKNIPNGPFKQTIDTLKTGSADTIVSGIVTTMFPTLPVIQKAIALKANFLIVHEPSFYNHADETEWLSHDTVYLQKRELIDKHNIAIWRCHDYLHTQQLNGVQQGVIDALGWRNYYNVDETNIINLPGLSLEQLITHVKHKLNVKTVRYIGDKKQSCKKILLIPGAMDGRAQMKLLAEKKPDAFICGELREWETAEYIRDARAVGQQISLIVVGHAASEEPGMEWLKNWLQPQVGNIKVTHVPSESPFSWE